HAGFVHQHETPWDAFVSDPVMHAIGSGHAIGHRSGLDAGAGWQWDLPSLHTSGAHVGAAALASWFPDASGPHLYGVIETLLTIDLGKPAASPSSD
ncbi:MAG: hypothetical protein ABMB14_11835, partial [Myxococcota bacterium]